MGEWVKFPTTAEDLQQVFERIGIGSEDDFGNPHEEWFITDYDCYVDGLYDKLGEYVSLDELNYLASKLNEMNQSEYEQFQAAVDMGDHTDSLQDLINLTDNLDCYSVYPDITDYDDLGRYYLEDLSTMNIPEWLDNYIDYEAYGRDIAYDEDGQLTDYGYVRNTGSTFREYYDGDIQNIPEEYRAMSFQNEETHERLTVLVVEPQKEPYIKEIDSGLQALQREVNGYIQAIYPYADPVAIVCNEDGKLLGMELNRALRDEDGNTYDVVAGTFLVVGLGDDDFVSLTPEQIQKYAELFKQPEQFVSLNGKLIVLPMEPENPLRTAEMTIEDDYGMIDGVINNGRRDEADKTSIRDKLDDAKQKSYERKPTKVMRAKRDSIELDD